MDMHSVVHSVWYLSGPFWATIRYVYREVSDLIKYRSLRVRSYSPQREKERAV